MIVTAWRIFKPKHAPTAFTGEGARLYGGRWNHKSVSIVYTASSQSLAALEMLVHLSSSDVLTTYQSCSVAFEDSLVEHVKLDALPADWRSDPSPVALKSIGDNWVRQARSAVFRVPSALAPAEFNYLLNPAHPDFAKIVVGPSSFFHFDRRLIKP